MLFLSEKDYQNAPEDPEEKFAFLADRCQQALYARVGNGDVANIDHATLRQYIAIIRSLAKTLGINEIPQRSNSHVSHQIEEMLAAAAAVISRVRLAGASVNRKNTVALAASTKIEIEKKISRLRIYISQADMPEKKRKQLLDKLNELSRLLEESRVKLSNVFIILSSVALGATAFLAEIPDALRTVTSVITMIAGDKEAEDAEKARLDAPTQPLAIEDKRGEDPK
jgi:hypothetical protein